MTKLCVPLPGSSPVPGAQDRPGQDATSAADAASATGAKAQTQGAAAASRHRLGAVQNGKGLEFDTLRILRILRLEFSEIFGQNSKAHVPDADTSITCPRMLSQRLFRGGLHVLREMGQVGYLSSLGVFGARQSISFGPTKRGFGDFTGLPLGA